MIKPLLQNKMNMCIYQTDILLKKVSYWNDGKANAYITSQ
jgi:hypothetical protein